MATKRNRECGKNVRIFSLDAYLKDSQHDIPLRNVILTGDDTEEVILDQLRMEELQRELAEWRPWGPYLVELYLAGEKRSCIAALVKKYKVSFQTARKYKRQFKKFFEGVSF